MVNYPDGRKTTVSAVRIGAGRRGMELEKEINTTNDYYLSQDRAVIYKKPTPVTIVNVDYPARNKAKITEAYFKVPSTTDYNGIYRGKYIDFEAKECHSRTSFPLKSIHPHQIEHLKNVVHHGAVAFVIIRFNEYDETWLIDAMTMIDHIKDSTRSSIPYTWFREHGHLIPYTYFKPVDYLQVVDEVYFKENTEWQSAGN
ncbi:MAG: Holliday junction resolvase RecU [Solobacterium sp.]|nr:Holliday junction resolvase RecU [Erysipelotrichaceae bacterium]MBQ1324670.1 Holliday junction resolvase RecU [Solobacterium sp.]MBQ1382623.1 Holliday junction resolvase RecU [Solobacterium sp.]MBQ1446898.1 Holliday junction resolvase RecU [Solobacterium sp.]MBQ2688615.1 Holliday junction resolvase RecU [Solobacterium sp.]